MSKGVGWSWVIALALVTACSVDQDGGGEGIAADAGAPDATPPGTAASTPPADAGTDSNAPDASAPDAPSPVPQPPSAKDSAIRVELGDTTAAALSASDPNGDALTFSIVTPPTKGQITSLDKATGQFTYTSTTLAVGTDTFTFQANDGTSNAAVPGTVHVDIGPVLFTGYWDVASATDNGAACSGGPFRLGQAVPVGGAAGFVEVAQRAFTCGSTTYTFKPARFDYAQGTVSDTAMSFSQSQFVTGCGTVTDVFALTRTAAGFVYTETTTTPCFGIGKHVLTGAATFTPSAYLSFVAPLFGRVYQGDLASRTMTIRNIGRPTATGITFDPLVPPFSFLGGSYPGTGGTCTNQVLGSSSCTALLDLSTVNLGDVGENVRASYTDAKGAMSASDLATGTVLPKLASVSAISAGNGFQCALAAAGVVCWGSNTYGQSTAPPLSGPTAVEVGDYHACALDSAGVHCWGSGGSGETTVPPLSNPKSVSVGGNHTCALDATGVHCWGRNTYGQITVPALSNPNSVAAGGSHTCAIDASGVHCWGYNGDGQTTVPALSNPKSVSAGAYHTCALDDAGAHCWGRNTFGQSTVPALTLPSFVSAGGLATCAIGAPGLQCWGFNASSTPPLSPSVVSVGYDHVCAVAGGNARCWGSQTYP